MSGLHTLGRWSADRARSTPHRIAIDDRGVKLSYQELEERAVKLAAALRAAGHQPGQRIATLAGNSSAQIILFFACAKAGLVLAPLSWRLSATELASQLSIAKPSLWAVDDEFMSLAASANEQMMQPVPLAGIGLESLAGDDRHQAAGAEVSVGDDEPLLMLFTSGTEAQAKAVPLSHANCFWNNLALSRTLDLTSEDTVLAVLPQYHSGGWNIQPLLALWTGATVVLERTFDSGRVLRLLADRKVTTMMGVPAHYMMLATHPAFAHTDLSALRLAVVGGAPMSPSLLRTWHAREVSLVQGYGLTEAGPNVLCLVGEDAIAKSGYAGRPYPHVDIRLADPVTGEVIEGEGVGELLVSGPSVFGGYFEDPQGTEAAFSNGWLRTGDLVMRDAEGYIKVIDRLKEIYISGGENVAPAEVEQALAGHPAVAETAVLGVPDERWGEVGIAFVVLRTGMHADAEELRGHCLEHLAHYKVPARFEFIGQLPRLGVGKIARSILRASLERVQR